MPADLNRAQDTPITTLKLMEITPKNWHRFPTPISKAMTDDIYVPTNTWNGGQYGDETVAETNVRVDDQTIGDYGPRNLTEALAWPGAPNSVVPSESVTGGQVITAIADYTASADITAPKGYIGPGDPYSKPMPAAPTITSLAPNTAVAGSPSPLAVVVTGTGFTQWSTLETGGVASPYVQYESPTKMTILMDPKRSIAGIVVVKVVDHGVKSAGTNFTYT